MAKLTISTLAVILLVAIIESAERTAAVAIVDSVSSKQCRGVCMLESVGTTLAPGQSNKGKQGAIKGYAHCMDSCSCGVFCTILEDDDPDMPYDACFTRCLSAKPNSAASYKAFVSKFLPSA